MYLLQNESIILRGDGQEASIPMDTGGREGVLVALVGQGLDQG